LPIKLNQLIFKIKRNKKSRMIKLKYRPEIDALRAIAVIAVIIYHAKIYFLGHLLFAGGYYGVDIFFVISGYLITSKIFNDLKIKKFSFKSFYLKRARRILPALFFTILISFVFSWFSLMPTQFFDFAKSSLFTIGFISNYYFYFSGLEYGAVIGLLKPILHTWSLGIEEQFYIIFPFFFFIFYKYFKQFIFPIFIFIFLFSFIFTLYFSNTNSILNFFLLPSRIWELLVGSIIFFIKVKNRLHVSKILSNFLIFIGLILILLSFIVIYDFQPTPNIKTLIPLIGTTIIILFYKKEGFLNILLVNKFTLWIGLISYSLYLLHYPIFAFVRSLRLVTKINEFSIVALLIFILSSLSYLFIEKPFRNSKLISDKFFLNIICFFAILIFVFSFITINKNGFEKRFPSTDTFSLDYQKYLREVNHLKYKLGVPKFINKEKLNILVIGDSHGRGTFNALKLNEDIFNGFEFSILDTEIACLKTIKINFKICNNYMTKLQKNVFLKSDIIILSSSYSDLDLESINISIKNLIYYDKKIIIASNMPGFYFENYQSLVDQFFIKNNKLPEGINLYKLKKEYFKSMDKRSKKINSKLETIAKNNKLTYLNLAELVCDFEEKICDFITFDGQKINFDDFHYSVGGAKYIGKRIYELDWLKKINFINRN